MFRSPDKRRNRQRQGGLQRPSTAMPSGREMLAMQDHGQGSLFSSNSKTARQVPASYTVTDVSSRLYFSTRSLCPMPFLAEWLFLHSSRSNTHSRTVEEVIVWGG